MYILAYTCVYIYIYMYMHTYIYIYRERERDYDAKLLVLLLLLLRIVPALKCSSGGAWALRQLAAFNQLVLAGLEALSRLGS